MELGSLVQLDVVIKPRHGTKVQYMAAGPSADLEWWDECGFRDEAWDFHLSYGYSNMPCLIADPIVRPPIPTRVRLHQESSQRKS